MYKKIIFRDHKPFLYCKGSKNEPDSWLELDSLVPYLNYEIELESGTLFDDFWEMIDNDIDVYNVIFSGIINNQDLKVYSNQFKKPSTDDEVRFAEKYRMQYFEIGISAQINMYEKDDIYFDYGYSFCGRGPMHGHENEDGSKEKDYIGYYGTMFSPINDWKGYELKINNNVEIEKYDMREESKNIPIEDSSLTLISGAKCEITVYDAIHAVLNELSWGGYPEDQMKKMHEIEQTIESTRRGFEKMHSQEDIKKELGLE